MSQVQVSHEDVKESSKPLKEKPSKAERRALQEAQRAAKSAKKGSPISSCLVLTVFFHCFSWASFMCYEPSSCFNHMCEFYQ